MEVSPRSRVNRWRPGTDDRGFTLIELLVVLIIIGILAAIAVPVFMNQRDKARMSVTTQNARNLVPDIVTARENVRGSLEVVTGSGFSAWECFSGTVPRVEDAGFAFTACGQSWHVTTQRLADAAGVPVETIRKMMTDGWGRPMVFDENEGEMDWLAGTRQCDAVDLVFSTGGHGTFVGEGGQALQWKIPQGGFCG